MEWISGNIFIRPNKLPEVGNSVDGHTHNFDHTTIVFSGRVNVKAWKAMPDGTKGEFLADRNFGGADDISRHFLVKADVFHLITALEPNTEFWCVYSHRDPQGDVSVANTGWMDAYF